LRFQVEAKLDFLVEGANIVIGTRGALLCPFVISGEWILDCLGSLLIDWEEVVCWYELELLDALFVFFLGGGVWVESQQFIAI